MQRGEAITGEGLHRSGILLHACGDHRCPAQGRRLEDVEVWPARQQELHHVHARAVPGVQDGRDPGLVAGRREGAVLDEERLKSACVPDLDCLQDVDALPHPVNPPVRLHTAQIGGRGQAAGANPPRRPF